MDKETRRIYEKLTSAVLDLKRAIGLLRDASIYAGTDQLRHHIETLEEEARQIESIRTSLEDKGVTQHEQQSNSHQQDSLLSPDANRQRTNHTCQQR